MVLFNLGVKWFGIDDLVWRKVSSKGFDMARLESFWYKSKLKLSSFEDQENLIALEVDQQSY